MPIFLASSGSMLTPLAVTGAEAHHRDALRRGWLQHFQNVQAWVDGASMIPRQQARCLAQGEEEALKFGLQLWAPTARCPRSCTFIQRPFMSFMVTLKYLHQLQSMPSSNGTQLTASGALRVRRLLEMLPLMGRLMQPWARKEAKRVIMFHR